MHIPPPIFPAGAPKPPEHPEARFCLAVLLNARNEILLLRRALDDGFAPGQWGLPGGHIQDPESPVATILRELDEEIGGAVNLQALQRVGPVGDTGYGGIYEVHIFLFRYEGGPIVLNEEHDALAWVAQHDYPGYHVVKGIDEDLRYLEVWQEP